MLAGGSQIPQEPHQIYNQQQRKHFHMRLAALPLPVLWFRDLRGNNKTDINNKSGSRKKQNIPLSITNYSSFSCIDALNSEHPQEGGVCESEWARMWGGESWRSDCITTLFFFFWAGRWSALGQVNRKQRGRKRGQRPSSSGAPEMLNYIYMNEYWTNCRLLLFHRCRGRNPLSWTSAGGEDQHTDGLSVLTALKEQFNILGAGVGMWLA